MERQKNMKGLMCVPIEHWVILNLTNAKPRDIKLFGDRLIEEATRMGITMTDEYAVYQRRNPQEAMEFLHQKYKVQDVRLDDWPLQLILFVAASQDTVRYNTIKIGRDIKLGVATQVMLQKNLKQDRTLISATYYLSAMPSLVALISYLYHHRLDQNEISFRLSSPYRPRCRGDPSNWRW